MASIAAHSLLSIESHETDSNAPTRRHSSSLSSQRSKASKQSKIIQTTILPESIEPAPIENEASEPLISNLAAKDRDEQSIGQVPSQLPRAMTVLHNQSIIATGGSTDLPPTPSEEIDIEQSAPSTPIGLGVVDIVQTWSNPAMNKWRHLAACLACFCNGMNDSAPGALLPYIEKHYDIDYTIVSMIFIGNAIGFILAAFFIHTLDRKFGRARVWMFSDSITIIAYILAACAPPFPVMVVAYFLSGYGMATTLALNNVFCANLANASVMLGAFHGSYGIGGVLAPIISTSIVTKGILFSRFYLILLGIRAISFFFGGWSFWHFERDNRSSETLLTALERTASNREVEFEPSKVNQLKDALKSRTTLIGAIFIFAYQGAEVSISGWVISFLINYRNSNPAHVGYVTAGFWGGITLGRFVMPPLAHRLGEKMFTYWLVVGALAFQLLVWFVPNVIGDSVAVAIVGLLLGPIYPCATTVFTRLLPRGLQNTALAFISSAGSSGGAIAPFATGIISQKAGTWVLHPVCIALFTLMEVCWFALPKISKRRE